MSHKSAVQTRHGTFWDFLFLLMQKQNMLCSNICDALRQSNQSLTELQEDWILAQEMISNHPMSGSQVGQVLQTVLQNNQPSSRDNCLLDCMQGMKDVQKLLLPHTKEVSKLFCSIPWLVQMESKYAAKICSTPTPANLGSSRLPDATCSLAKKMVTNGQMDTKACRQYVSSALQFVKSSSLSFYPQSLPQQREQSPQQ